MLDSKSGITRGDIVKLLILRTIGNFLLLFALFGVFATFGPAIYYEASYKVASFRGIRYRIADIENIVHVGFDRDKNGSLSLKKTERKEESMNVQGRSSGPSLLSSLLTTEQEHVLIPASPDFSLVIPKIGANQKIFENVDPTNQKEYLPLLQKGIAHAKGTVFPGMGGTIYLFAHSADNFWDVGRYNAVFYLLKELSPGDEIVVFYKDRRYTYEVFDKKVADPTFVSYLTENIDKEEILVLQTCWPPGTTWKRLFVFAKPKA